MKAPYNTKKRRYDQKCGTLIQRALIAPGRTHRQESATEGLVGRNGHTPTGVPQPTTAYKRYTAHR